MKINLAALALVGIAIAPVASFAQSAPAPINQTGPSVTAPVSGPTDPGIEGVSGNTRATPGGIYNAPSQAAAPGYGSYAAEPSDGPAVLVPQRGYSTGAGAADDE